MCTYSLVLASPIGEPRSCTYVKACYAHINNNYTHITCSWKLKVTSHIFDNVGLVSLHAELIPCFSIDDIFISISSVFQYDFTRLHAPICTSC